MATHFYNRTLFNLIGEPIPNCYLDLDNVYDINCNNYNDAYSNYLVFSENICKRHSDIKFYARQIVQEYYTDNNPFESSLFLSTYLVGYFSAVKSFTDAISICLNEIFSLNIKPFDQDLTRKEIWKNLEKVNSEDYKIFKPFFEILNIWRNQSSHQLTPIVGVHGPTSARAGKSPEQIRKSDVEIKMANVAGLSNDKIKDDFTYVNWVTPLFYINDWDSKILELANLICFDIAKQISKA